MVPIKIECDCGQHYAFDVEPVEGRMPAAVTCPGCGAEGTTAANEFISQQLASDSPAVAPHPKPMRLSTAQPAEAESQRRGLVDLNKARQQAKAKIMWGESEEQVAAYLAIQGLSRNEAVELAHAAYQERAAIVRSNGIKKIAVGFVLACVPVVAYFLFHAAGGFPIRRSIWCYAVGIYGAYMFITGIMAVIALRQKKALSQKNNVVSWKSRYVIGTERLNRYMLGKGASKVWRLRYGISKNRLDNSQRRY